VAVVPLAKTASPFTAVTEAPTPNVSVVVSRGFRPDTNATWLVGVGDTVSSSPNPDRGLERATDMTPWRLG
jgi:hypothetical protein